jgi:hypothetical protein
VDRLSPIKETEYVVFADQKEFQSLQQLLTSSVAFPVTFLNEAALTDGVTIGASVGRAVRFRVASVEMTELAPELYVVPCTTTELLSAAVDGSLISAVDGSLIGAADA